MGVEELQRQIRTQNEAGLWKLRKQLETEGVIPFVGAGMSADFGNRQWSAFLAEQAKAAEVSDKVQILLKDGLFEEAAQAVIEGLGKHAFEQAMDDEFGDHKLDGFEISGAVAMLPKLSKKHVITTNFDHVLEWVFGAGGPKVNFRQVLYGTRTQAAVRALNQGARVLIKIHGDVAETEGRILTKAEYDLHYGPADPANVASTQLTELMKLLLMRPLLFLGCSLEKDRVVVMLKRLQQDLRRGLGHFAILAAPSKLDRLAKRRDELASMGIRPIWYPEGKYEEIPNLLAQALGRSAPEPHERLVRRVKAAASVPVVPMAPMVPVPDAEIDKLYWDGVGQLRVRRYEAAGELLSRVAAVRPDYEQVQVHLQKAEKGYQASKLESSLRACEEGERWGEAMRVIEEWVNLAPGDQSLMERRERIRKKAELKAAWQEAGELFKRENWEAVVESFQQMEALEPGLKDSEGWLATARRRLREAEIQNLIAETLRKATKYFESGEWTLALPDLERVLELDSGNEVARELQRQAQEKAAEVKAAETLAQRYAKAVQAIRAKQWEKAVDLLNLVIRGHAAYKDARALLKKATEQLDETKAELKVSLSVKPAQAPPNSKVMWMLKIRNSGRVPILHIVATELHSGVAKGSPVEPAFRLAPDESKAIPIKGQVTDRGVRRHFEVVGTTPGGRSIREEMKASVNIKKAEVAAPEDKTTTEKVQPKVDIKKPEVAAEDDTTTEVVHRKVDSTRTVVPGDDDHTIRRRVVPPEATEFRDALRLAKHRVDVSDLLTRQLIGLLAEGEAHYRFTIDASGRPADWTCKVDAWQEKTAQLKLDKLAWVSLGPPPLGRILEIMKKLAREIQRHIGVEIPLHEFELTTSARI
jgi:tetratricopeptide (TPR) repeat protein